MNVYLVKFDEQRDHEDDSWERNQMNVLANGDARQAIAKAEKKVIGHVDRWKDEETGKAMRSKVTGFRLREVSLVCEIDA